MFAPLLILGCQSPETFGGFDALTGGGTDAGTGGGTGGDSITDAPFDPDLPGAIGTGGSIAPDDAGSGGSPVLDADDTDQAAPDVGPADGGGEDLQKPDLAKDVAGDPDKDTGADAGQLVEPNLVGYWKFDEAQGTTLHDSSNTGNDATIHNTPGWVSGSANLPPVQFADSAAIVFNANAYAVAGNTSIPKNNASQTIAAWVNFKSVNTQQYLVCLWNPSLSQAIALGILNNQLTAWKWGTTPLVSVAPPSVNVWHHVAYTFDGTTHKLYVDGGTPATGTGTPNTAAVTRTEIAAYNAGAPFNGTVDELRIYDVALTAAQVAALAAGKASATGP
ncbi:MAG TPA: LamG domain-containing protein [Polyangia bacterium]|nr:LamG domain-containing protein [Polyangia bacterium]